MSGLSGVFDIVNRVDVVGHINGGTRHHTDVLVVVIEIIRITQNSLVAFHFVGKRSRHTYHPVAVFHVDDDVFGTRSKQQRHEANHQYIFNFLHGDQYLKL